MINIIYALDLTPKLAFVVSLKPKSKASDMRWYSIRNQTYFI